MIHNNFKTKYGVERALMILLMVVCQSILVKGIDSTKYYVSLKYSTDLSDTFGGGDIFSGEIGIVRFWYGVKMEYGHFNSQSVFLFKVPYEELGKTLEITVPEMSIMKTGSFSGFVRPISKKWITGDVLLGAVYSRSKSFYLKSIDYEYNIEQDKFTYVLTDYYLHKANHFGYQVGVDITFWISKRLGCQLNARFQDLSNGGTFIFCGTGLSFNL